MNNLPTFIHDLEQEGNLMESFPESVRRILSGWEGGIALAREFSFGMVASVMLTNDSIVYMHRYIHMDEGTILSFNQEKAGLYFHSRKKGQVNLSMDSMNCTCEAMTCGILYIPAGKHTIALPKGISLSTTIEIDDWLLKLTDNKHVRLLSEQIKQKPDMPFQLPFVQMNYWLTAILNLVLNIKQSALQELSQVTGHLFSFYLNELDNKSVHSRDRSNLALLTGHKEAKPLINSFDPNWEIYEEIVKALPETIKENYTKKEAARKIGLSEEKFSKLFREGYGKSFKEGYVDFKMMMAINLVSQDQKLSSVAKAVGYSSQSNFSTEFKKFFGYPPSLFQSPGLHL